MKPLAKKVNRRERLLPVKNEPCFERKAILSGRCPSGDCGRGRVGSEIELCSATFLREVAPPKFPLTETVTMVEIEDSHSMKEVDTSVTQKAPVAELRLEPTPTREETALGRRSAPYAWPRPCADEILRPLVCLVCMITADAKCHMEIKRRIG